ncbi:hypothetical protein HHK36_030271 [Tetracentron sinense]|uniref:Alpha-galactosidase n=1 Tax=Tetracentron sinense TaxID=13715 RepID=A0A835D054_TETSI|nr:hypothetical protein HHK36_030271 [Tetracentron sinense]
MINLCLCFFICGSAVASRLVEETESKKVKRRSGTVGITSTARLRRKPSKKLGNLVAKNSTFPSGIKALADYVHSMELKLGIYSDVGYFTCSKTMPGSLGHEEQDAKTFASWVSMSSTTAFTVYRCFY